jgi:tetratricopeptide (TPR) repeat protein
MGVAVADQIALRIGINVADVLYDDSDIAGGGVNLAARLETLAPPGGICISQALREQIHEDLGVSYLDAGSRRVKNISKPVRVIHVLIARPTPIERSRMLLARLPLAILAFGGVAVAALAFTAAWVLERPAESGPEKLSLQVREFRPADPNDTEAARVGELLAQQIYLALTSERNLLKLKGQQPKPGTEATHAGSPIARYAIEGVVSTVGGEYRVQARLVGTQTRDTFWGDGFGLRDATAATVHLGALRIAHALFDEVWTAEGKRIEAAPPWRPDSTELLLQGYATRDKDKKRKLFEQAVALDPANAAALLALLPFADLLEQERLSQKAVSADPQCAAAWSVRAKVLWLRGQTDAAREAVARSLNNDPSNPFARYFQEFLWLNEGRWERVIRSLDDVEFEFPSSGYWLGPMLAHQCHARVLARQDPMTACNRWFAVEGSERALIAATAAMAQTGTVEQALRAGDQLRQSHPQVTITDYRRRLVDPMKYSATYLAAIDRALVPALSKAGVPD